MNGDNSTAPGWYEATRVESPQRARLNFDLDVDVCVIGAGLAGLTVAREVAQRGWSVAVLEGGNVAHAASGRNTGFVLPGYSESIDDMIERIGLDHTKQLWALSEQGLDYVRRTIDETGMPGVEKTPGWLHVDQTDNADAINATVERLRWIGADAEMWETERVRAHLVNPRYFNAVHFPKAFHIHPLNYALGLAALAEKAGARIFEQTPALSIDPAGVRKRIVTPSARVRAARVVLAGNVQLGGLMPAISATLVPVTTFVMVTEPLGPQLHELIRYRGAVSDSNRADNHYRIVGGANTGGERLQWSGRMRAWQADPHRFARGLVADIKRNFPGLGPVEVAHIWRGTLGRTVHRMPQIGEIEPGVWLASGFGGHGLNTTAMAGDLVARGLIDGDQTWRLFAPYELVWAGGKVGSAIAQGFYWGRGPGERIAQALSRYRERRRIAKQQRLAALAEAVPVLPRPMVPAAELAAVPVPDAVPVAALPPSGGQPAGPLERRRNRGKRAKGQKAKKAAKSQKIQKTDVEPAEPA
jgi:glycine/D-amino acid oxidase-like deaminating enzyme